MLVPNDNYGETADIKMFLGIKIHFLVVENIFLGVYIIIINILQTRGEMTDWLKELSLFDHFLHGLFKYLNENTGKPNSLSSKWKMPLVIF